MAGNTSNTGSWVPQVNTVGLRNVGSYQVSGHPYTTGSKIWPQYLIDDASHTPSNGTLNQHEINFPYVTKSFTLYNTSSPAKILRVHFENTASQTNVNHYVSVGGGESFTFETKCTKIYITGNRPNNWSYTYNLYGSLTNIPTSRMFDLTGSGISD